MTSVASAAGRFGPAFDQLGVEAAWSRTRGAPQVVIGVVARGVRVDHALIVANIRRDHARRPEAPDADDNIGTAAAVIAAGRESRDAGCAGVAPEARLLPVQFSASGGSQTFDAAHAIEYAAEMGASIVLVTPDADLSTDCALRAIQYAATRNALVVCTAGQTSARAYDERLAPNLLQVLAVDDSLEPMPDAGTGLAELAAPGFARLPDASGARHDAIDLGFAAAYVSGCAALVKTLNPAWGYHEIKEHLLVSATSHAPLAARCREGAMLDVASAIRGPIELDDATRSRSWPALMDATMRWKLRYRSALCANLVALFRESGSEHWRELGHARARDLQIIIPAEVLRPATGALRLASRDANFHADDVELTIQ